MLVVLLLVHVEENCPTSAFFVLVRQNVASCRSYFYQAGEHWRRLASLLPDVRTLTQVCLFYRVKEYWLTSAKLLPSKKNIDLRRPYCYLVEEKCFTSALLSPGERTLLLASPSFTRKRNIAFRKPFKYLVEE